MIVLKHELKVSRESVVITANGSAGFIYGLNY
jgi:hypothetical protein